LIVTLASLVPAGYKVAVYENADAFPAQVLKRDVALNLALLKIEKTGLQTAGFVGNGGVALGERLILVAKLVKKEQAVSFVNQGSVKKVGEGSIATSISERENVDGAPLFDVEGRVAGLADADFQGNIFAIPASVLRVFLGL
jgi:S1-C subfamily serine protease